MTNAERLFLIKAAGTNTQLQPMYNPNDQASMLEAYKNRGQPNMSFTPDVSTLPGNFGFSNEQDFNRAKGLTGVMRRGNLLQNREEVDPNYKNPWKGVSPQMTQGVMDMRRSVGTTGITSGFKGKFTAPETQTGYDKNQPGGSNYYHGLHHLGTDEFGDHKFSTKPRMTDIQFRNQSGTGYNEEAFDKAMKEYDDGVYNYQQYGTFNPTKQQTSEDLLSRHLTRLGPDTNSGGGDLLSRRLAETGLDTNSGGGDLLSRRLAERGMGPGMNVGGQAGSSLGGAVKPTTGMATLKP